MELEDKNKLFVFDKKEVVLIFVFVLVIIVTSFTLGVRVGKGLSLKSDGYSKGDIENTFDLKSVEEEHADDILSNKDDKGFESSLDAGAGTDSSEETARKLDEIAAQDRMDAEFADISKNEVNSADELEMTIPSDIPKKNKEVVGNELVPKEGQSYVGKFTINLASKKTRAEAEEFSAPYIASDLEVIINKVKTSDKGTWYRVGIGAFNTYNDARDFLKKNPIFFKGKKYWITEIKK